MIGRLDQVTVDSTAQMIACPTARRRQGDKAGRHGFEQSKARAFGGRRKEKDTVRLEKAWKLVLLIALHNRDTVTQVAGKASENLVCSALHASASKAEARIQRKCVADDSRHCVGAFQWAPGSDKDQAKDPRRERWRDLVFQQRRRYAVESDSDSLWRNAEPRPREVGILLVEKVRDVCGAEVSGDLP